ncbi:sensor histidine kinase [Brevibacillus humidisoli]|uniref:sensor histidine kinase n=1 Tax=Brevibacillus humidisoli TaxID=2895522 RepID=UPI001E5E865C|nr:sensor histidine kinase [Brevibacillus humidisoli]UFJ41164.1 sensor histidine kinase [Brevibacillus humidisoli]
MWDLLLSMFERLCIIVTVAFVVTRFHFFRRIMNKAKVTASQRLGFVLVFGFFGIIGTYTGLIFHTDSTSFSRWALTLDQQEAIANSRAIGVVIAGLLGGWKLGLGAGLIAGVHRYLMGGYTALACGSATVVAGVLAGLIHRRYHVTSSRSFLVAFVVGFLAEAIQMGIILLIARPFEEAWILVQNIGIPMMLANGIGTALFILIIRNVVSEEEKMGAMQAHKALRLATFTLSHLRKGLSVSSARVTCEVLLKEVVASAVAITDKEHVLAHAGLASSHHRTGQAIKAEAVHRVLSTGELLVTDEADVTCGERWCPLQAAIIAPLKQNQQTIGTVQFFFRSPKEISPMVVEMARGLSGLLSQQLEMAEMDQKEQLLKQAEIKALQAQVSPHFLFNALNTIISMIRSDPMKARKLLVSLSHFFRQNLAGTTATVTTLEEELKHVKAYLAIEEARFADKLQVVYEVAEEALAAQVPPMSMQPIVENAVKHGLRHLPRGSRLTISIKRVASGVQVAIRDNGSGMDEQTQQQLTRQQLSSAEGTGIGIYNVHRRLIMAFGEQAGLAFQSEAGCGTTVSFTVPFQTSEKEVMVP